MFKRLVSCSGVNGFLLHDLVNPDAQRGILAQESIDIYSEIQYYTHSPLTMQFRSLGQMDIIAVHQICSGSSKIEPQNRRPTVDYILHHVIDSI